MDNTQVLVQELDGRGKRGLRRAQHWVAARKRQNVAILVERKARSQGGRDKKLKPTCFEEVCRLHCKRRQLLKRSKGVYNGDARARFSGVLALN